MLPSVMAASSGGVVDDDWTSIHWNKIDYLISCGLRPWYLDHSDPGSATPSQPPRTHQLNPSHVTPEAPHVLASLHQQQKLQQQLPNQAQLPPGQQQAWAYPVSCPTEVQPG